MHESGTTTKRRLKRAAFLLGLGTIVLATRLALLYRHGSPEPDSLAMATGMTMALHGAIPWRDAFLYGREGSPGMFLVGRFVYPVFFREPGHLLPFLNAVTVLASVAMVWPAYAIARRFGSAWTAAALVLIAMVAPAVWELSTYFHPTVPAVALLLFAIHAGLDGGGSRASVVRSIAAVVLGAAAVLCRVHMLFALPGLIVAACLSTRRGRNLFLLATALALAGVGYAVLQTAVAKPESGASRGVVQYASMIVGMYAHGFSMAGLSRTVVWTVSGLGVATVAAIPWTLVAGRKPGDRGDRSRHAALIGIAWALPSLLFWLPQPVPILRHVVLPTFGIALALAGPLNRLPARQLLAAVLVIVAGNIAIPELAYRAYNARHPGATKTPHGAVFSFHEVMRARIDRFDRAASDVIRVTGSPGSGGAVVLAQWGAYAHVLYDLALANGGLRPVSTSSFFESVQDRRYRSGDRDFRFILYVYFEDPELKDQGVALIRNAVASGYGAFVPRELADGPLAGMLTGLPVHVY
jgi:hypothetical protein